MQPDAVQPPRSRLRGSPCTCYVCGVEVYPFPLDVDVEPGGRLLRGYPAVALIENAHTHRVRLQPRLFCPACAEPTLILQNERVTARRPASSAYIAQELFVSKDTTTLTAGNADVP